MKDGKFHAQDISKLHFPNSFKTFCKVIRLWQTQNFHLGGVDRDCDENRQ